MGFTKAPWKAVAYSNENRIGYSTHEIQYGNIGECIAEVVHGEADAKLIAAAPEMIDELILNNKRLEVVKSMLSNSDRNSIKKYIDMILESDNEVIKKATS